MIGTIRVWAQLEELPLVLPQKGSDCVQIRLPLFFITGKAARPKTIRIGLSPHLALRAEAMLGAGDLAKVSRAGIIARRRKLGGGALIAGLLSASRSSFNADATPALAASPRKSRRVKL